MSQILDYRTPANELRLRRITRALWTREAFFWIKTSAMLTSGVPTSLVGPAFATWVAREVCRSQEIQVSGPVLFALSCLVLLPLLYLLEMHTRGNFLTDELRAQGHSIENGVHTLLTGRGGFRQSGALHAMYVEVFLFGPRMTIGAVRQLTARLRVGPAPIQRAAGIVMLLAVAGVSVAVSALSRGESSEELRRTLTYLHVLGWIDLGDQGRRAWLLSTARERLPA